MLLLVVLFGVEEWHAEVDEEAAAVDEPTREDVGIAVSESVETEEAVAFEDEDGLSEGRVETDAATVRDANSEAVEFEVADADVVALDDKQAVDDTETDRDEFDEPDAVVDDEMEFEGVGDAVPDTVLLDEVVEHDLGFGVDRLLAPLDIGA